MSRSIMLLIFSLALITGPALAQDVHPTLTPLPPDPLPAGPITVVTLGDSLTEGAEDELEKGGYPGRLLEIIEESRPGSTLLNVGHSGWNSDALINGDQGLPSELEQAEEAIAEADQPAVALVWIGSNDLFYLYEYNNPDAEGEQADLENYERNLDTILTRLTDAGAVVFLALLDDQSQRPVTKRGEAFTSISVDEIEMMAEQIVRYNEVIVEKATEYGAFTVDFYETTIFTDDETLADDGNHPNAAGYDIITDMWFEALQPALEG
jgi:lysophospholipase L1-like esterase